MNAKLAPIFARRSIRDYKPGAVGDEAVRDLLEAGMAAPSACCRDPWEFVVVKSRGQLRRIAEGLPHGHMLGDAAVGIVVCGDMRRAHDGQLSYLLQDCSAAIENMLLAASMLGFGACWLGVHPREDRIAHIRTLLHLPPAVLPISVIAVGWPKKTADARTRYKAELVHSETW